MFLTSLSTIQAKLVSILVVVIVLIGTHAGVWYFGYQKGKDSYKAGVLEATVETLINNAKDLADQQARFNDSVTQLNNRLDEHGQTVKIINTNMEKELEKAAYRNTSIPDSGMQLLTNNANALNSKRVPRSPASKVPAPTNTDKK